MRMLPDIARRGRQGERQREAADLRQQLLHERARALAELGELQEAAAGRERALEQALAAERSGREAAERRERALQEAAARQRALCE